MKRLWILLLLSALLLTGCGKTAPESPTPVPSPVPTAVPQMPTPEPVLETPEDPVPVDAALYSPDDCRYPLFETDDVLIEIVFARELSYNIAVLLRAENRTDADLEIDVFDILLNGSVQTNVEASLSVPAKTVLKRSLHSNFSVACALIGYENLRELSASVTIRRADGSAAEPQPCSIAFPEGIRIHYAYEAFRGMRADRQMLKADETVAVALLGCGCFFENTSVESLTGVLWVENRGSEQIPVKVSSVSLDGIILTPSGSARYLDPGSSCVLTFTVYGSDVDLAGIQSIGALNLQLLTSAEENSAVRDAEGGAWYPVALAQSGESAHAADDNKLLYDDGLLVLGLNRTEIRQRAYTHDGVAYTEIKYIVSVENRRAEGISLYPTEAMIDDAPLQNGYSRTSYVFRDNYRFGPQSKGFMILTVDLPADDVADAAPVLSFLLQVRSQGEDSLFYTTAERIVLADHNKE